MKKILIGITLDKISDQNVKAGIQMAKLTNSSPVILHADKLADFDTLDTIFTSMNMNIHEKYIESITTSNKEAMAAQLRRINATDELENHVLIGDPADCIIEMARDKNVDLICLGYNQNKNFLEKFIGGVTESVLHRADRSTLIVKSDKLFPVKNIVVAYDFSHYCDEALKWAIKLSKNFSAKVHLVNVVPCYYEGYHVAHAYSNGLNDVMSEVIEESVDKVKRKLNEISAAKFKSSQVQCSVIVDKEGSISDSIVAYAEKVNSELVILGSHKKGTASEILLGSVCNKVMKKSRSSVLIAK